MNDPIETVIDFIIFQIGELNDLIYIKDDILKDINYYISNQYKNNRYQLLYI